MVKVNATTYLKSLRLQEIDILEEEELLKDFRDRFNVNKFSVDEKNIDNKGFSEEDIFKIVYYSEHSTYEQMSRYFNTTQEIIKNLFDYCEFYKLEEEPSIVDVRKQIEVGKEKMLLNHFTFKEIQKYFDITYKEIASIESKLFGFWSISFSFRCDKG